MANIRLDLNNALVNGQTLTFKSPASCCDITGLVVYYLNSQGETTSTVFQFADAHGNNVGGQDLFTSNVMVKVIMDTELNRAYVQNADTNSYLENKITETETRLEKRIETVVVTVQEEMTGFEPKTTQFSSDDSSITEVSGTQTVETEFVSDSVIVQKLYEGGQLQKTKTVTFSADGLTIEETIEDEVSK